MIKKETKEKIRTVRLKYKTIENLDKIAEMKIKEAIEKKTFNIKALVKTKRGISYDKEIFYLSNFYLAAIEDFKKLPKVKKKNSSIGKLLKKIDKINKIC